MKKYISFSLAALLFTNAFAQEIKSSEGQLEKKSSDKKSEVARQASLDGRSFKVFFTERNAEAVSAQSGVTSGSADVKTLDKPVSDYSMFDANSKVMLTFTDGKILSPIFLSEGCSYRINTSGNDMYAFSSYCRLNTGNKKVNDEMSSHDTKMEMDAANSGQPASTGINDPKEVKAPVTVPPDETKQHLPPGTARDDNAGMNTPPAGTVPPSVKSEDIQRQVESPVNNVSGSMATISGVVNGNAIKGTLSWTDTDGKRISYAFSGSAATKKDMNDTKTVGMR